MNCKKCGAEIKANVKFCNKCGAKITIDESIKVGVDEMQVKGQLDANNVALQVQENVEMNEIGNGENNIIENAEKDFMVDREKSTGSDIPITKSIETDIRNVDYSDATSSEHLEKTNMQAENYNDSQAKKKSKKVAGLLAIFLGFLGIHWFYLRKPVRGIIYLIVYFIFPIVWLLYAVEGLFFIFCKEESFFNYISMGSSKK